VINFKHLSGKALCTHAESFVEIEQGTFIFQNFVKFSFWGAYAPTHAPILAKFGMEEWIFVVGSISGSAGPIFTIFAPHGRYSIADDQSDHLLLIS